MLGAAGRELCGPDVAKHRFPLRQHLPAVLTGVSSDSVRNAGTGFPVSADSIRRVIPSVARQLPQQRRGNQQKKSAAVITARVFIRPPAMVYGAVARVRRTAASPSYRGSPGPYPADKRLVQAHGLTRRCPAPPRARGACVAGQPAVNRRLGHHHIRLLVL